MIFSHAIKVSLDLVAKTMVKVGQPYAFHTVVLAVSRSNYVPGRIVSCLRGFYKQKKYYLKRSCDVLY